MLILITLFGLFSSCRPLTNPLDPDFNSGERILFSPVDNGYIFSDNPVLSWPTVSSERGYHIQINADENFNGTMIIDDATLSEAQYTLSDIPGAEGTAIGTGEGNTADIVAHQGTGSIYAAQLFAGLEHGGYDDWFLPSKDELNFMYENLHTKTLGGFADDSYWSSSEYDSSHAWRQGFDDGSQYSSSKTEYSSVLAARAF